MLPVPITTATGSEPFNGLYRTASIHRRPRALPTTGTMLRTGRGMVGSNEAVAHKSPYHLHTFSIFPAHVRVALLVSGT